MRSLLSVMSNNDEVFGRLAVHPSTNFPGRTQENILFQLLRKKPEPDVAASLDEGRKTYAEIDDALKGEVNLGTGAEDDEDEELSPMNQRWAALDAWIGKRAQRFIEEEFPEDFTAEELDQGIENVRTGLRRKFEEYEEEDEEDEDDADGGGAKVGTASKAEGDEDDVVMLDRPPPPPPAVPSLQSQASQSGPANEHVEGLKLENMLRVATLGHLSR